MGSRTRGSANPANLCSGEPKSPQATFGRGPRAMLPVNALELPPMGPAFDETLEAGLGELDLVGQPAASDAARQSYELHARLLREWGAVINLTAIRDPAEVARRHVVDSLSAVPSLAGRLGADASLLDVGSGPGYPGLPLAAALPLARVGLLDSVAKKARFLEVAAAAVHGALGGRGSLGGLGAPGELGTPGELGSLGGLGAGPPRIEVINERAEDLAEDPELRGAWDVVTARAVGSLAEVVELGMPLTRVGGVVVAWKHEAEGGTLSSELRDAGSIIRATGGGRPDVVVVSVPSLPGHRLVVVPKLRATPPSYPRPAATRRPRRNAPC